MKKIRGIVYCRKLTALPLGEKLRVDFDNDGIYVGNKLIMDQPFLSSWAIKLEIQ